MRRFLTFLIGFLTPLLSIPLSIGLDAATDFAMQVSIAQRQLIENGLVLLAALPGGWLAARHDRQRGLAHWLTALSGFVGLFLVLLVLEVLVADEAVLGVEIPTWAVWLGLLTPPVGGAVGIWLHERVAGR